MARAKISRISARPILDSRGDWTIEVRLEISGGKHVVASVPQGKSTGSHEAETVSTAKAVRNIEKAIFPRLKGKSVLRQREIDDVMLRLDGTANKRRLGGNAILGVSIAVARASAMEQGIPLWWHVRNLCDLPVKQVRQGVVYPRLYINVINGGLHAGNNLDFQEYLVIPKTRTYRESVFIGERIYHELGRYLSKHKGKQAANLGDEGGYAPDFKDDLEPFGILKRVLQPLRYAKQVDFGLDAAATGIGLKHERLAALYRSMARTYALAYLEDPFGEEDFLEFETLKTKLGPRVMVAGDDLTTTNVRRMEKALANGSVNAVIIKPNQIGTVSESLDAVRFARKHGWAVVASHRSGETNDDFIADFAYGVGADGIKLGAPARGERVAKYNRLLAIEQEAAG